MTPLTKRERELYRRMRNKIRIRSYELSGRELATDRRMCGVAFGGFIAEMNPRDWYGREYYGFTKYFVSPSEARRAALDLYFPSKGAVSDEFYLRQRKIREAGESGDWKTAVLYAMWHGQRATTLGFDFVLNARSQSRNHGAMGGSKRSRHSTASRRMACEYVKGEFLKWKKDRRPRNFQAFWESEAPRISTALKKFYSKAAATLYRDSRCEKFITAKAVQENIRNFDAE
jgi:hypothetical protein